MIYEREILKGQQCPPLMETYMIRSLLFLSLIALTVGCSRLKYINKDKCTEIGGPVLECPTPAILN